MAGLAILLMAQIPPPPTPTADPVQVEAAIKNAESYLGQPYAWGGRNTSGNPGIDCLGLLYLAWGPVTGTPWRSYPVDPSKIVASKKLGTPVDGAAGVLRADLDQGLLQRGDVLYFLNRGYEIPDEPLWVVGEDRYWPWHTGLYAGDGVALHAEPGGVVRRQPLDEIPFDALYVTRVVKGP